MAAVLESLHNVIILSVIVHTVKICYVGAESHANGKILHAERNLI